MKYLNFSVLIIIVQLISSCGCSDSKNKLQNEAFEFSDSLQKHYHELGRSITKNSFLALSSALLNAIDEGGTGHALHFCKLHAIPITDSLSRLHHVEIKRLAIKARNPANKADKESKKIIEAYQEFLSNGKIANDTLILLSNQLYYYAPIFTAPACLQCHGTPKTDFTEEHETLITNIYPKDQATGFVLGELRGVWQLTFNLQRQTATNE